MNTGRSPLRIAKDKSRRSGRFPFLLSNPPRLLPHKNPDKLMKPLKFAPGAALAVVLFVVGCQSGRPDASSQTQPPPTAASPATPPVSPSPATPPAVAKQVIRVKAGASAPVADSAGHVWLPDQGFDGGDVIERPGLSIANTKDPMLYQSEHYSMQSFSRDVPNGNYIVKLHFAETFEGIAGPGERVFSFNVQGHEFKDFDVWVKAGGPSRAYIETVPVEVTNGVFRIGFTSKIENPQINAIEIIPES